MFTGSKYFVINVINMETLPHTRFHRRRRIEHVCSFLSTRITTQKIRLRKLKLGCLSHAGIRRNAVKNLSLSVGHTETNDGAAALSWNMSAPCRLEAEVWPCRMATSLGAGCREVPGFRQIISTGWEENISMVWVSQSVSGCVCECSTPQQIIILMEVE